MSIVTHPAPSAQAQAIRIPVRLTPKQYETLHARLIALFPELAALRNQRRLQMLNDVRTGQFRIQPLAGAALPTSLTPQLVSRMIATVQAELPADSDTSLASLIQARMAYRVAHSRAGRRVK